MAEPVEAPEDLYGVDLADFVRERNALAGRLKAAGDTEAAAAVRAMRKPPRSVAALNALARSEPAQVDQVLAAARAVADALGAGGDQLRAAQSAYAQAVTATVDAAADRAGITGEALERVRSTLLAAGAEPDGDVATRLRSGTLAEDAAAPGFSFAGVVAGAQRPADVSARRAHRRRRRCGSSSGGSRRGCSRGRSRRPPSRPSPQGPGTGDRTDRRACRTTGGRGRHRRGGSGRRPCHGGPCAGRAARRTAAPAGAGTARRLIG